MSSILLSFFSVGNSLGYILTWIFGLGFSAVFIYAMKKYMKN